MAEDLVLGGVQTPDQVVQRQGTRKFAGVQPTLQVGFRRGVRIAVAVHGQMTFRAEAHRRQRKARNDTGHCVLWSDSSRVPNWPVRSPACQARGRSHGLSAVVGWGSEFQASD